MRHAGGAEHVPVGALDRRLVARHERRDHARLARIGHAREDRVAHRLARALDRMPPGRREALRRRIARAGADVAGGLHVLLPEPELLVEAVRIETPVRRLEPHREAPALARMQRRGRAGFGLAVGGLVAVPGERDARRHARRRRPGAGVHGGRPAGRFHVEPETHAALVALRHLRHHPDQQQVAPFDRGVQRAGQEEAGAQPREPAAAGRAREQRRDENAAPPSGAREHGEQESGPRDAERRIGRPSPEHGLLQLQRAACDEADHRRERPCRARGLPVCHPSLLPERLFGRIVPA